MAEHLSQLEDRAITLIRRVAASHPPVDPGLVSQLADVVRDAYVAGEENAALTEDERSLIITLINYAGGAIGRLDCEALRAKLGGEGHVAEPEWAKSRLSNGEEG